MNNWLWFLVGIVIFVTDVVHINIAVLMVVMQWQDLEIYGTPEMREYDPQSVHLKHQAGYIFTLFSKINIYF